MAGLPSLYANHGRFPRPPFPYPHAPGDMRIVDDAGKELQHDGKTVGHLQVRVCACACEEEGRSVRMRAGYRCNGCALHLRSPQVRGPATVSRYFKAAQPATVGDSWFPTGDVVSLDRWGGMQITDRSKDVIKSGA